jgi:hypothetical protein
VFAFPPSEIAIGIAGLTAKADMGARTTCPDGDRLFGFLDVLTVTLIGDDFEKRVEYLCCTNDIQFNVAFNVLEIWFSKSISEQRNY